MTKSPKSLTSLPKPSWTVQGFGPPLKGGRDNIDLEAICTSMDITKQSDAINIIKFVLDTIKFIGEKNIPINEVAHVSVGEFLTSTHTTLTKFKEFISVDQVKDCLLKSGISITFHTSDIINFLYTKELINLVDSDAIFFGKVEQSEDYDPNYFYFPQPLSTKLEGCIGNNISVFLVGPTGSGKSEMSTKLLGKDGSKIERIDFDGDICVDDIIGYFGLSVSDGGTKTEWIDGILPRSVRNGYRLVLNEVDGAPPEVLFCLYSVLNGEPLFIKKTGEYVPIHDNFRIFGTANTVGKGDDSSLYRGTHMLNEAFLDRWGFYSYVDYAPEDEEIKLIKRRTGIPDKVASNIVEIALLIRDGVNKGEIFTTMSTRRLITIGKLFNVFKDMPRIKNPLKEALDNGLTQRAGGDKSIILEVIQRVIG